MLRWPRIRSLRWRIMFISYFVLVMFLLVARTQAIYVMSLRNIEAIDRDLEVRINELLDGTIPKFDTPLARGNDEIIINAEENALDLAAMHEHAGILGPWFGLFDFSGGLAQGYRPDSNDDMLVTRLKSDGSVAETKKWLFGADSHHGASFKAKTSQDGRICYAAATLRDGGTVIVSRSLSEHYRDLKLRFLYNIIGSSLLFAAIFPVWWYLVTQSLKSYDAIAGTANLIVKNNRDARIDVPSMDSEMATMATNLNAMLDHVNELHEAQAQFLADASHELRTPLAGILNNAQMALSQPNNTEELRRALAYCQTSATRMKQLVNDLLDLTRSEGRSDRPYRKVLIDTLMADALEQIEPIAQGHNIELDDSLVQTGLVVFGDSAELLQVLVNLLTNAIQHSEAGSVVQVGAKEFNKDSIRHVWLWVSDTGAGIDPTVGSRIFQRFLRGMSKSEGTGLGLAICRAIIHAHGGTIAYRPNEPKGTTFVVTLEAANKGKWSTSDFN
jgi:signal transduction histidine kinase